MSKERLRVVVIGAGISGLAASRALSDLGHEVVTLDKARGPGGRMSTRREAGVSFDHGAPSFSVCDPVFRRQVLDWQSQGRVVNWGARFGRLRVDGRIEPLPAERLVGVPGMSAICREMADALPDCRFSHAVDLLQWDGDSWSLHGATCSGLRANSLILAVPPLQAVALLKTAAIELEIGPLRMHPCWAVLAVFDRPLLSQWDDLMVDGGPLSRVSSQRSKPGRPTDPAWVLHATPDWSQSHLEADHGDVSSALLRAARRLPGAEDVSVIHARAHRWRYARAPAPSREGPLHFPKYRLAMIGDWRNGGDVEGAYLCGLAAARALSTPTLDAGAGR